MVTRKQSRIHQKKERKQRIRLRRKKLLMHRFFLGIVSGLGSIVGSQIILNLDSIFSFVKELFLIISNSRYKIKGDYF